MKPDLLELINEICEDCIVDAGEVVKLSAILDADGVIDREESDALFMINDKTTGNDNCDEWKAYFVKSITAHVLADDTSPGKIDANENTYLQEKIGADGVCDSLELALCVAIITEAEECVVEFIDFTLEKLKAQVLEDGIIDKGEVELISAVIYGSGGSSGANVDKKEAEYLFALNDATSGKENSDEWQPLFVEALSKYYLEDETSPGEIDQDEAGHLKDMMGMDGNLDGNEIALLGHIKITASAIHEDLDFLIEMASK
jgi:hypothetical protein